MIWLHWGGANSAPDPNVSGWPTGAPAALASDKPAWGKGEMGRRRNWAVEGEEPAVRGWDLGFTLGAAIAF